MKPESQPPGHETAIRRHARRLFAFFAWVVEPDRLPPAPPDPDRSSASRSPLHWWNSRETLPSVPTSAPIQRGFFSWLAGPEPLPAAAPAPKPVIGSFLRWLVSGDQLHSPSNDKADKGGLVS